MSRVTILFGRLLDVTTARAGLRAYSTSTTIDQMGSGQEAVGILRSGLALPCEGVDRSRLYMALSEVHARDSDWAPAAQAAESAAYAAANSSTPGPASQQLLAAAMMQQQQAVLTAGWGEIAQHLPTSSSMQQVEEQVPPAIGSALQLQLAHALGGSSAAAASSRASALEQQLQAPDNPLNSASSSSTAGWGLAHAFSWLQLGHAQLAQGLTEAALTSYGHAEQHAAAAVTHCSTGNTPDNTDNLDSNLSTWSPALPLQVQGDARLGRAQVSMSNKDWSKAEQVLGEALTAATAGAGGSEDSPVLVAPLLLLGQVYSRSARVMFAEGMLRQALRLMGATEPHRLSHASGQEEVHPSLAAAVAWRYSQLLTALPNRGGEASAWAAAAEEEWKHSGQGLLAVGTGHCSSALGDLAALTGKGSHGDTRVVVSLLLRRLLPPIQAAS